MNRSVISIEEGTNSRLIKNSIGQEVSIPIPLRSEILPQRLKGRESIKMRPAAETKTNTTKLKIFNIIHS